MEAWKALLWKRCLFTYSWSFCAEEVLCNKVKNAAAYIGVIASMSREHYGAVLSEDFGAIKPTKF